MKKTKTIAVLLTLLVAAIGLGYFLSTKEQPKTGLKIGDSVPAFELYDQNGELFSSLDFVGKTKMVIYFYPKDDSAACTEEACTFRDRYESFAERGVLVVGISQDDIESHRAFAEKYNLPFKILSDTENKVRKLFGVRKDFLGFLPGRETYMVNQKGLITSIYNSQFEAGAHVDQALVAFD